MSDWTPSNQQKPAPRVVISLAGSGFRAALFHLGALRRLNELGLVAPASAIHAVAGGSLVLGLVALKWPQLEEDSFERILEFEHHVSAPIEQLAARPLNLKPSVASRMKPKNWNRMLIGQYTPTDRLIELFDRHLFDGARLADLAGAGPEFRWHATNLRTGGKWEFSPTRMGESHLGYRAPGETLLAEAVAASMVEPSELPPHRLWSERDDFETEGDDLSNEVIALRPLALLMDGSPHDPLAIDSAVEQPGTVIVCDGGTVLSPAPAYDDWIGNRMLRSIAIQQHRAVEVRRRWFVESIRLGRLEGTYAALAAHHADYGLPDSFGYARDWVEKIWKMPGGLALKEPRDLGLVVNHGYTIIDAAVRRLLPHRIRFYAPLRLPFPDAGEVTGVSPAGQNNYFPEPHQRLAG